MGVSRSGYYKWLAGTPSRKSLSRPAVIEAVREVHERHSTHGYRWVAAYLAINKGIKISPSYAYKCFRFLGLRSQTRHKEHYKPRKVKDKYPNLIFSTWDTVDRPRQVIVSDMTAFKFGCLYFEVTFYFDVFTKEILAWRVAVRRGDRLQYIDGLVDLKTLLVGCAELVILHTDQGSVYTSSAYNEIISDTVITRSMSRAGKPTDNPVNESLNGWIKEELFMDFAIARVTGREEFRKALAEYVKYYNTQRPCFALGYDTPANYKRRFDKGELERRDTFSKRELDPTPKFVRERRKHFDK